MLKVQKVSLVHHETQIDANQLHIRFWRLEYISSILSLTTEKEGEVGWVNDKHPGKSCAFFVLQVYIFISSGVFSEG